MSVSWSVLKNIQPKNGNLLVQSFTKRSLQSSSLSTANPSYYSQSKSLTIKGISGLQESSRSSLLWESGKYPRNSLSLFRNGISRRSISNSSCPRSLKDEQKRHFSRNFRQPPTSNRSFLSRRGRYSSEYHSNSNSSEIHGAGGGAKENSVSHLFIPAPVKLEAVPNQDRTELTAKFDTQDIIEALDKFCRLPEMKMLSIERGLDDYLFNQTCISFRKYCLESETVPADLHLVFKNIIEETGPLDDLFAYFIKHANQIFPHLECLDDLKKISNMRSPASWYSEARGITRKIVYHAGPTNSGKTYKALQRFLTAKSGIYCGPTNLSASDVFHKANEHATPTACDLLTPEERRRGNSDGTPASHIACTVNMASVHKPFEVAVIDEIQMLRDPQRGWAWTRALLGVVANEIHLCGEDTALDLIRSIMVTTGEELEVHTYKRLTELEIEKKALESLDKVQPGDCVVCFSKNDIYSVSRQLESKGHNVAVIDAGVTHETKSKQVQKFNDPDNPCKYLVASEVIGMGLDLNIRRIIFYSMTKPTINEREEREVATISTAQALRIAGRAGRYGTQFSKGMVTTFNPEDLHILEGLMAGSPEKILQAGLHVTADQMEKYSTLLPHATLSNLMDIFVSLSTVDDSRYFLCNVNDFKYLADMIEHIPLPIRTRYIFCSAPINNKTGVSSMFLKFARRCSRNEPIQFDWLCSNVGWPFNPPKTIVDLIQLEMVSEVLDLYLWLSYHLEDSFPDAKNVQDILKEAVVRNSRKDTLVLDMQEELSKSKPKRSLTSTERNFITPLKAMQEFLFKSSDLAGLRKTMRRSPHADEPPITVYWRRDVEQRALEIWGSMEELKKEKRRRGQQNEEYLDGIRVIDEKVAVKRTISNIKRILKKYRKEYRPEDIVDKENPMNTLLHGSGRIVLTAVTINGTNFMIKLLAWSMTGSHSLFAEAIHSLADTINQLILAYGIHKSGQRANLEHPYGYANMRHVASLISGVGIFCVGAGLSFYHGIIGLVALEPIESLYWAFYILAGSFVSEGATLFLAVNAVRKRAKDLNITFKEFILRGRDPSLNVVILEDTAAVAGVAVAATCMGITMWTNSPVADSIGSLVIGGLLGGVASFIIYSNSAALVGRSIPRDSLDKINTELEQDVMIRAIHDVKGIDMGNTMVRYKAEVDFDGRELTKAYLDKQDVQQMLKEIRSINTSDDLEGFLLKHGENIVDTLGAEIDRIETRLKQSHPEIRHCDLEIL